MATLLLLSKAMDASAEIVPALGLLQHQVRVVSAEPTALLDAPPCDALLLDARTDLIAARSLCRLLRTTGADEPVVLIVTEAGVAALSSDWGFDDFLLDTASPGEIEARLRVLLAPRPGEAAAGTVITTGGLEIDEAAYAAKLDGRHLDLTYTEFELLKYLAQHPGRVFSRQQLLSDVWGYDYYGGTRTVDVHIRRLRAKLGPEHEALVGTVRNVGYRFVMPAQQAEGVDDVEDEGAAPPVEASPHQH